ncbi:hypothetical protein BDY17DRAFT_315719 [Neohortaea acidophila]|uniref:TPR domain-containing protein n=1 Tax=Neohortaea acidophila TaxID=245834 RepID=A0A6A6PYH4_9PEZI|nr:uncharacterized protein BDY17DRAFT_315719 [Neohortaea acidophila]KAF2485258.1 hypothetical protein BDY17DRAFT_315719 [Neohortaea acidophila]
MTLAFLCIVIGGSSVFYANYIYYKYIIGAYHNYPEEVAKKLRRAIFYTKTDFQPKEALKYYKQALAVANEVGMDPFSDEVMGIKIQIAGLLQQVHQVEKAILVLEQVRGDNLRWLELYDEQKELHANVDMRKKKTRILAKTIAISVKLGEHYADGAVWDRDMALERLVWAVETSLAEKIRRQAAGATEESDGPWMTDEEQGASLEALAHGYEERNLHYLATPLFLQALGLKGKTDCHSVVLMNNIASSLAQQSPQAARAAQAFAEKSAVASSDAPSGPVATKEMMVESARTWAERALDVAAHVKPPERDEECDLGCAVATHNLGEFAEMVRDTATAEKRYREAISLSRAIGFQDGVDTSSERLRALLGQG